MIGYDDRDDPLAPARGIFSALIVMGCALLLGLVLFLSFSSRAHAQQHQPSNCSGTATSTSTPIVFPTSGATGPTFPSLYLTIANPSASATLWVCVSKGCTATANTAASIALSPVGGVGQNGISWWRDAFPPPLVVSILSSAATSPFTCVYE